MNWLQSFRFKLQMLLWSSQSGFAARGRLLFPPRKETKVKYSPMLISRPRARGLIWRLWVCEDHTPLLCPLNVSNVSLSQIPGPSRRNISNSQRCFVVFPLYLTSAAINPCLPCNSAAQTQARETFSLSDQKHLSFFFFSLFGDFTQNVFL